MKTLVRAALAALCASLLQPSTFALTPGPTIVRACPGCTEPLLQFTIGSGNLIGVKYWTDGKRQAPMLPELPQLVKCPKCSVLLWIKEAKELGRAESWAFHGTNWDKAWDKAPPALDPTEGELLNYASSQKLTNEREMFVRQHAWWLANDPLRKSAASAPQQAWSPAQKQNLMALAALLDETDGHQRHLKAEIARELGRFDECQKLLAGEFVGECRRTADFIRGLNEQKDTKVHGLPEAQK